LTAWEAGADEDVVVFVALDGLDVSLDVLDGDVSLRAGPEVVVEFPAPDELEQPAIAIDAATTTIAPTENPLGPIPSDPMYSRYVWSGVSGMTGQAIPPVRVHLSQRPGTLDAERGGTELGSELFVPGDVHPCGALAPGCKHRVFAWVTVDDEARPGAALLAFTTG
jgi:hypothetical protein